ncbi:twin-arginine translocase subunit TatC [Candidatus Protochlamydia naegleriophila]|nr:twin-arginine translocase subunit TatC [Candidatus Protochlamydia naegleriophila]
MMLENEVWKSLWGHLADLRSTLIRSFTAIGIGFLIVFSFYQPIFHTLTANWERTHFSSVTKEIMQRERVVNTTSDSITYVLPRGANVAQKESFEWIDAQSLRLAPKQLLSYEYPLPNRLLILGPLEGMVLTFKVCFWCSLALTAPIWGYFFLQFFLPGLRSGEKALLIPFFAWSGLWMGAGFALAYFVTIPLANSYLEAFNAPIGQNAWTLTHYIDYTLMLFLGHALAFEMGLLLLCLVHYQWISADWLISKRRHMIVCAFIIGALLTPPDIPTQFMMAIPLISLYELAILYGKWQARLKHAILP